MFSTVQQKFTSALSYFGYGSESSRELPKEIYQNIESQSFAYKSPLQDQRITSKPPSIWKRVASLGMSYLFFSNGQSSLQLSPSDFTPWATPLTFMAAGLSIFPDTVHAQLTFIKALGGPSSGYALMATPEGDLVVTGYAPRATLGVLLAKFSSNGTLLWANTLGGAGSDEGKALATTPEGDLIIAGSTTSSGAGDIDILLSKFSSNGTLLWTKTLGGSDDDQGLAVALTLEGEIFVTGHTSSFGAGGTDLLLSKFSSNGTLVWTKTLGGSGDDQGLALALTLEGEIFVTGFTTSFGAGSYDALVSKFSSNGTLVWTKTLGGEGGDNCRAVTVTSQGEVFVTGTTSFGAGAYNVLLAKYSSNGTLLWAHALDGGSDDQGITLMATPEGDLIVSGITSSFGAGGNDVLLAKFSSNGAMLWATTLGGAGSDIGYALTATSEGDLIITGDTNSFSTGSIDILLAKLNAQGSIENCSAWQSVTPQVQSITPNITDVTLNMTIGMPPWTSQDARSVLNVTDITNLLNQTKVCPVQTASSQTLATSPEALSSYLNSSSSISSPLSQVQGTSSTSSPASSTSPASTIPSISVLVYEVRYSIIVNGQAIGTFYFTGGSGQLNSDNVNTLIIEFDRDIEDGETITLFTIPEGEEPQWQDIILSYESESGCVTTEGVFTTTSEEKHSYQLIFIYESDECSYSAAVKLAAIPVLGSGIL